MKEFSGCPCTTQGLLYSGSGISAKFFHSWAGSRRGGGRGSGQGGNQPTKKLRVRSQNPRFYNILKKRCFSRPEGQTKCTSPTEVQPVGEPQPRVPAVRDLAPIDQHSTSTPTHRPHLRGHHLHDDPLRVHAVDNNLVPLLLRVELVFATAARKGPGLLHLEVLILRVWVHPHPQLVVRSVGSPPLCPGSH